MLTKMVCKDEDVETVIQEETSVLHSFKIRHRVERVEFTNPDSFLDDTQPQLVMISGIGVIHWREWMIHPRCTCSDCPSATNGECEFAYDLYNKDDDCLAMK